MNNLFESAIMNPTFVFVDGSYYCFYRYFALMQWWKNAYPEEPLDDPYQNEKFVEKFNKTFVDNLEQIPKKLKIHNSTLEHDKKTEGVYTIESWIVEDVKRDKSAIYNLNAVEGAWVVVQRIDNEEVWTNVKNGLYQGYSIEGYFSEKAELNLQESKEQELIEKIKQILINV